MARYIPERLGLTSAKMIEDAGHEEGESGMRHDVIIAVVFFSSLVAICISPLIIGFRLQSISSDKVESPPVNDLIPISGTVDSYYRIYEFTDPKTGIRYLVCSGFRCVSMVRADK